MSLPVSTNFETCPVQEFSSSAIVIFCKQSPKTQYIEKKIYTLINNKPHKKTISVKNNFIIKYTPANEDIRI